MPAATKFNRGVTRAIDAFLRTILAPHPRDRVPSATDAAATLEQLIHLTDPEVGPRDVGLLVGLFLATRRKKKEEVVPSGLADLLAQELALFSEAASSGADLGAMPLDPDSFLSGS